MYKKTKTTVFQNPADADANEQNRSDEISDIKLDDEYVNETDGISSQDDESVNSKDYSEDK